MSNFISVPRELLERVAAQADCMLGFSSSSNYDECLRVVDELRALLAKPVEVTGADVLRWMDEHAAEQPQGEPVAYADPKAFENFGSLAHLGGLYAREWMWANPADGLVALYTRPAEQPAPATVVPEGYCVMPRLLTAENGAKALLLGEFTLQSTHECPECRELEEPSEGCEICDGEGEYGQKHTIPWDQIKFIYSKAVEGLAVKAEPAKF